MIDDVLSFWFEEVDPQKWWAVDAEFDEVITQRFGNLFDQARYGELFLWRKTPRGRLAEVLILDQFSRNIHRNTPQAFSQDAMALVLAQEAVAAEVDQLLSPIERSFLYMPFMHSESRVIHQQAELLFRNLALQNSYDFELRHKAIIDRFGRYPHRNAILGRTSTQEELAFLKGPNSSF